MGFEDVMKGAGHTTRNLVIGVAILILTMFVVVYGINTFYEKPEYDDFCGKNLYDINNEVDCVNAGGEWEGVQPVEKEGSVVVPTIEGRCSAPAECREEYDIAREDWSKNVFLVAVPLGILIIALGAFVFSLNAVGIGLMLSGVGTLLYGAGGYWRYSDNLFKFIISLIGLVVLIFLAYWFNKRARK